MKIDEFKGGTKDFNADSGSTTTLSIPSPPSKASKKGNAAAAADPSASSGKRKPQFPAKDTKGKRDRRKPPVPIMRSRSDVIAGGSSKEGGNSSQLRKSKSEWVRTEGSADGDLNLVELRRGKLEIGEKVGTEGELDDEGVVEEKVVVNEGEFSDEEEDEEGRELEEDESEKEVVEEKKVSEIKEIVVFEPKREENPEKKQEQVDGEIDQVPAKPRTGQKRTTKPVPGGDDREEVTQLRICRNVANPSPPSKHICADFHTRRSAVYQNYSKSALREHGDSVSGHGKLQNLADLIMWRDVSKSTLVFGLGTFTMLSSSYAKDVNISCISVVSYMGLVYLALIFLYRSLVCRGSVEETEGKYVLGEEEAMWVLRLVLPYLNEFLLKLKALFSGDPATTMKLAVPLFVLARCGSSITIWNLSKFGFFGVFVVPKLCSSYSSHITSYCTFWVRRFKDAWDSCTHKKAVSGAVFTLVWNLCTAATRIWAVFMLYVAFRYYQQQHAMEGAEFEKTKEDEDVVVGDRPKVYETSKGKKALYKPNTEEAHLGS